LSDELDSASVRQLAQALHGLSQRIDDLSKLVSVNEKTDRFRDQATVREIGLLTAEVRALGSKVDRSLKLTRHVGHEIADSAVKAVREETGKHLLYKPEPDEITGRQWRYLFTHKVGPWLAARGFLVKLFAVLAAAAGAAWAWLTHKH
jgi:hypothetical protein